MSRIDRAHFIRGTILRSLHNAQPYGVLHDHLVGGILRGRHPVSRDEVICELTWLQGKKLIDRHDDDGGGDSYRWELSPNGVTFVNYDLPWDKVEVIG